MFKNFKKMTEKLFKEKCLANKCKIVSLKKEENNKYSIEYCYILQPNSFTEIFSKTFEGSLAEIGYKNFGLGLS